jgi:hypothetical protein
VDKEALESIPNPTIRCAIDDHITVPVETPIIPLVDTLRPAFYIYHIQCNLVFFISNSRLLAGG